MKKVFITLLIVALLAACVPASTSTPTSTPIPASTTEATAMPTEESAADSVTPSTEEVLMVAFAKDGDIHLWDSETNQSRTIVKAGDVTTVMMSDDGQVIAFLRRSGVQSTEIEGHEQSALWAVDRNGGNPRELISAESLRQRLNASQRDSTNIPQMEWVPGTHRLLFSGWFTTPLAANVCPLAIPYRLDLSRFASLHWSPAGDVFTGNLQKLCPNATQDSEICDARIHLDGNIAAIHWIDGNRLLFLTRGPSVLFLGKMDFAENRDGTTIPIVAWPVEEAVSPMSFTTVKVSR